MEFRLTAGPLSGPAAEDLGLGQGISGDAVCSVYIPRDFPGRKKSRNRGLRALVDPYPTQAIMAGWGHFDGVPGQV